MKKRGLAFALALVAAPVFAQTPSPSPTVDEATQRRIDETRRDVEELRDKIANADEREREILAALDETEREMAALAEEIDLIKEQVDAAKAEMAADETAIAGLEAKIAKRKRWLSGRLRSLYIHGRPGYLKILFASESYADLLRRSKYQSIVSRHDADMVGALKADLETIATRRSNFEEHLASLEGLEAKSKGQVESLEMQRAFRRSLVEEVQSERADLSKVAHALEEAAQRLTDEVGRLGAGSQLFIPRPFAGARGKLLAPVANARVTRAFGPYLHPTAKVEMRHQGIKYAAPLDTPVHAVWDGKVEMARWLTSYGQVLIVDHGSGWRSLYAHNAKLLKREGEFVKEGDVIATSGDSGSLEGPELFFAIYFEGKAIDPAEWLVTPE